MNGKQIQIYRNAAGTITFSAGMSDTDDTVSIGFILTPYDAFVLGKALSKVARGKQQVEMVNLENKKSEAFMDCGHYEKQKS